MERRVGRREFATRLAKRSLAEFGDDNCSQLAASIAYHVLFSIFPLAIVLAAGTSIVLHATGSRESAVNTIVDNVPLSASGEDQLRKLLLGATGGLSALGLIGLVGLVYSASGMMASVRVALNQAWDLDRPRPFLRGKLVDVGLVFGVLLLSLASLGLTIATRFVSSHAGGVPGVAAASWLVGILVPLAIGFVVVLFLYTFVPAAEVRVRETWPAALFAAAALVVAENLFALYVGHFANYNAVYGSLGAVIAFMFFVYLSAMVFLLGAEVASEWPRVRRALAQSGGPPPRPRPAGRRSLGEQLWGALRGLWAHDDGERERGSAADESRVGSGPDRIEQGEGEATKGGRRAGADGQRRGGDQGDRGRVAGRPGGRAADQRRD